MNPKNTSLERELKPEFIKEIEETLKHGKFVKVKNFAEEYGIQGDSEKHEGHNR